MPTRPYAIGPVTTRRRRVPASRRGFTLVELIVVIGIMLLLMGILLPVVNRAYATSTRISMYHDLGAIQTALEAYKGRHNEYPPVVANNGGAAALARAMGSYRLRSDGPVQQPLLPAGRLQVTTAAVMDRQGRPILYYLANPAGRANLAYVGNHDINSPPTPRPVFNARQNNIDTDQTKNTQKLARMIGDNNLDGKVDLAAGETADATGAYLLISGGPDRLYGPSDASKEIGPDNPCDDIGNFNLRF